MWLKDKVWLVCLKEYLDQHFPRHKSILQISRKRYCTLESDLGSGPAESTCFEHVFHITLGGSSWNHRILCSTHRTGTMYPQSPTARIYVRTVYKKAAAAGSLYLQCSSTSSEGENISKCAQYPQLLSSSLENYIDKAGTSVKFKRGLFKILDSPSTCFPFLKQSVHVKGCKLKKGGRGHRHCIWMDPSQMYNSI